MNLAGGMKKVTNQPFDIKCSVEMELENTDIFCFLVLLVSQLFTNMEAIRHFNLKHEKLYAYRTVHK